MAHLDLKGIGIFQLSFKQLIRKISNTIIERQKKRKIIFYGDIE